MVLLFHEEIREIMNTVRRTVESEAYSQYVCAFEFLCHVRFTKSQSLHFIVNVNSVEVIVKMLDK